MARSLTCVGVEDRIDAYLAGSLGLGERKAVERHLANCPSCRDELAFLRTLLHDAEHLPRTLDPERDLWPEIADRLDTAQGKRSPWWRQIPLAAAVLAVVALSGALVMVLVRDRAPTATTEATGPRPLVTAATLEAEYADALADLESALEAGRDLLAPETIAVIEQSLRLIDAAIAEAREALAADPANAELARRLGSSYELKVDLLRRAARLATEI